MARCLRAENGDCGWRPVERWSRGNDLDRQRPVRRRRNAVGRAETYRGASGCRLAVSHQLCKWPRQRSIRRSISRVSLNGKATDDAAPLAVRSLSKLARRRWASARESSQRWEARFATAGSILAEPFTDGNIHQEQSCSEKKSVGSNANCPCTGNRQGQYGRRRWQA